MAAIRRKNTKPELALRSALHAAGYRFRVDYRIDLDGGRVRPDVVFTRARVAVFVDGCFFHRCPHHGVLPATNADFWLAKLTRNVERDREQDEALRQAGWTVVRLWQHVPVDQAVAAVTAALRSS
jgi:DNA mismatch endonuclease (patch repair protein)